jgi:hypothetical protein
MSLSVVLVLCICLPLLPLVYAGRAATQPAGDA